MGLRHLQRGSPVHCSQDHVALVQKILVGKTKKIWFIFYDKNGLFAMLGFRDGRSRFWSDGFADRVDARQIDFEGCSAAGLAVNPNVASALLDDAVDRRKAKTRSFRALGSKERLEDAGLGFGVHADTRVADGDHHVL